MEGSIFKGRFHGFKEHGGTPATGDAPHILPKGRKIERFSPTDAFSSETTADGSTTRPSRRISRAPTAAEVFGETSETTQPTREGKGGVLYEKGSGKRRKPATERWREAHARIRDGYAETGGRIRPEDFKRRERGKHRAGTEYGPKQGDGGVVYNRTDRLNQNAARKAEWAKRARATHERMSEGYAEQRIRAQAMKRRRIEERRRIREQGIKPQTEAGEKALKATKSVVEYWKAHKARKKTLATIEALKARYKALKEEHGGVWNFFFPHSSIVRVRAELKEAKYRFGELKQFRLRNRAARVAFRGGYSMVARKAEARRRGR